MALTRISSSISFKRRINRSTCSRNSSTSLFDVDGWRCFSIASARARKRPKRSSSCSTRCRSCWERDEGNDGRSAICWRTFCKKNNAFVCLDEWRRTSKPWTSDHCFHSLPTFEDSFQVLSNNLENRRCFSMNRPWPTAQLNGWSAVRSAIAEVRPSFLGDNFRWSNWSDHWPRWRRFPCWNERRNWHVNGRFDSYRWAFVLRHVDGWEVARRLNERERKRQGGRERERENGATLSTLIRKIHFQVRRYLSIIMRKKCLVEIDQNQFKTRQRKRNDDRLLGYSRSIVQCRVDRLIARRCSRILQLVRAIFFRILWLTSQWWWVDRPIVVSLEEKWKHDADVAAAAAADDDDQFTSGSRCVFASIHFTQTNLVEQTTSPHLFTLTPVDYHHRSSN